MFAPWNSLEKNFWTSLKTYLKTAVVKQDRNFGAEWVISVDERQISCTKPNGVIESVGWKDLRLVLIQTTNEGPYVPDVFWYLIGDESGFVVPLGATGEEAMLEQLQQLPGFDNEAVSEAMTSTSNRKFVCWQWHGCVPGDSNVIPQGVS